ncbi:MAG: SDR family oxidoreductase [Chloroflexi bacterium]|nr:SDR family oxidoreductase [Chloroflexota bacterium]
MAALSNSANQSLILVTGATGYVGGRLIPRLLEAGYRVRILARDPERLQGRTWLAQVEIVRGDVLKPETLDAAMHHVNAAYYLVHSMSDLADFRNRDLTAAKNFGNAAKRAGVGRILYLGGLGNPDTDLSKHLRSRQETGEALRQAGVPVTEFRAAIIVGSGSVSFEIIRTMTERVPLMICPRWVYTRIQPIAIRDVLSYLVEALRVPESADRVIEIGGADVQTYGEMILGYARARGLKRWLIPVPVLTPNLSSYWVHWMTPISANIAHPLIEGLRNQVIVRDDSARQLFPQIQPLDYASALQQALEQLQTGRVETSWSDALLSSKGDVAPVSLTYREGVITEARQKMVAASAKAVYRIFSGLGGERGWLYANWLWSLRGVMDRLVGGVGFRRGRRHPDDLHIGDALDFWRVEQVEPNRLLRLRAEMKVPGLAWLEFQVNEQNDGTSRLMQTAFFVPHGLLGLMYWYLLYPIHSLIFSGMIRAIAQRAEAMSTSGSAMVGAEAN